MIYVLKTGHGIGIRENLDDVAPELRHLWKAYVEAPPEGWKLAPINPTEAMALAGKRAAAQEPPAADGSLGMLQAVVIYRAMLDEAPDVPSDVKEQE